MSITYKEQLSKVKEQNYMPEEIYVGKSSRGNDEIVGFMIPYIPGDPTYAKKKETVDAWAGKDTTPTTFKNELSDGYSIIKQVRRYESDAVYWRVLHPEGFEFEISLDNFEYLMENHVIDQGVLVGSDHTKPAYFKLVQKRKNRKWIMVDRQHPAYIKALDAIIPGSAEFKALEQAVKDEEKSFNSEVQIGDVVELGGYSYGKYEYLGTFTLGYMQHRNGIDDLRYERKKIYKEVDKRYGGPIGYEVFSGSKKVSKIVRAGTHEKTIDDSIEEIIEVITHGDSFGNPAVFDRGSTQKPVGIWAKKPKKKDLTIRYTEALMSEFKGTTLHDYVGPVGFSLPSNVVIQHQNGNKYPVVQYTPSFSYYNHDQRIQCQYTNEAGETVVIDLLAHLSHAKQLSYEYNEMIRQEMRLQKEPNSQALQTIYASNKKRFDDEAAKLPPEGLYHGEHIQAIYMVWVD